MKQTAIPVGKKPILLFLIIITAGILFSVNAKADTAIVHDGRTIGTKDSEGIITYIPKRGDNAEDLDYLLGDDSEKTVILPEDETIYINSVLYIGSNTTIDATGATIIQTNAGERKGLIKHKVDGYYYDAIKNVTITGGTWKKQKNNTVTSFFRFAHGRKLKFENVTIVSNYKSHAMELIACRDVTVKGCTLKVENNGTRSMTSVEDALQIDVATPTTAPGVYAETGDRRYVNGQTCRDVTVQNCNIEGARGICANYASTETMYKNSYHRNITIKYCNIEADSAQGIALYNTVNCLIQGNTVKTTSIRENLAYPSGINLYLFGTSTGGTNQIIHNKIYGARRGIYTNSKNKSYYFGKTIIRGNTIYVKKGLSGAMCLDIRNTRFLEQKDNELGQW